MQERNELFEETRNVRVIVDMAAGVKHERARQEMERIEKAKEQKNERSE